MKKIIKRKLKKPKKPRQQKSGFNVNVKIDLSKKGTARQPTQSKQQPKTQSISYTPWTATQYNPNMLSDIREGVKADLSNVQKKTEMSQKQLYDLITNNLSQRDSMLLKDNSTDFEKLFGVKEEPIRQILSDPVKQKDILNRLGYESKPNEIKIVANKIYNIDDDFDTLNTDRSKISKKEKKYKKKKKASRETIYNNDDLLTYQDDKENDENILMGKEDKKKPIFTRPEYENILMGKEDKAKAIYRPELKENILMGKEDINRRFPTERVENMLMGFEDTKNPRPKIEFMPEDHENFLMGLEDINNSLIRNIEDINKINYDLIFKKY